MQTKNPQASVVHRQSESRSAFAWIDLLWLVFLAGLAALSLSPEAGSEPPWHKQLILLGIGTFQLFESRLLKSIPVSRSHVYSVLIKIGLATLLVAHTGNIFSSYYLVYFLPVVSSAMVFGLWGTLTATALAAATYWSFVIPALHEYEFTAETATELAIRSIFFFLAAVVVNRFVMENRRQAERYQKLAETLAQTNRQLAQAQAEARRSERLAALGQLSAGLAHELRNPLGVIKGSAEMLAKKLPSSDPLATELAGYISSEVNRLNGLVSRFLDFARPLALDRQPNDVAPIVDRALKAAEDRWPGASIDIERRYAPILPKATLDAGLCEQVFTNLAFNAYQAMLGEDDHLVRPTEPPQPGALPAGSARGKLRVAIKPANSDGRSGVEIDFEDTGPGIPPELTDQIFNPFFTTKKNGVGLGLSIVSNIVDEHRGWIRVESVPGKGTRFRVFLPAE